MTKKPTDKGVEWDLEQILPAQDFDKIFAELEAAAKQYISWQKKLKPDMTEVKFKEYFAWHFEVIEKLSRLYSRYGLLESVNSKSAEAKRNKPRAQDLSVRLREVAQPISMWLKGKAVEGMRTLDEVNALRLFASLKDMEYPLMYAREMARHTLSQAEESIINHKDATGVSVLADLRDMIETDFTFELTHGAKTTTFESAEQLKTGIYSPDPEYRKATYEALFAPYIRDEDKFFKIYQSVVKDWAYEAQLRGYKSPIAMRNAANQVSDRAVEVLLRVCQEQKTVYQDFFKWKAKRLGAKKLQRYDLYAPLGETKTRFSYDRAVDLTLESFRKFSSDFASKAKRVIDENHIDSHPSAVKRGGAFCSTIAPSIVPYVMLNFAGRSRDVATLAHELGHAVHSMYADDKPIASQHANLPLAETASTLGEAMLFESLLERAKDDEERQALLAEKIADSYATVLRQTYFVRFEQVAHEAIPKGADVSDIRALWLDGLREQLGDAVEINEIFQHEWAYIPHIVHTPYYCYAYSFGELLSLSLYARFKKEGSAFIPKIEAILEAGGSREPKQVLKEVGIDYESEDFWRGGFDVVKGWVTELK
jgi:oligoendopeptidase F